eukprot:15453498-Heterocapsa_arctica.AAC.1
MVRVDRGAILRRVLARARPSPRPIHSVRRGAGCPLGSGWYRGRPLLHLCLLYTSDAADE